MIIENEHNRTTVAVSVTEALELIQELSKAADFALKHGHRSTNGMAASEVVDKHEVSTGFKPSSFVVAVGREFSPFDNTKRRS